MIEIIIALSIAALLGFIVQTIHNSGRIEGLQADVDSLRNSTRRNMQLLSAVRDSEELQTELTALMDALGYEIQQQPSRTVAVKKEAES